MVVTRALVVFAETRHAQARQTAFAPMILLQEKEAVMPIVVVVTTSVDTKMMMGAVQQTTPAATENAMLATSV